MYLGIDSSTQSLSAVVIDPANRGVMASHSVNFGRDLPSFNAPSGFIPGGSPGEVHADPLMWLAALDMLLEGLSHKIDLHKIRVIAGSGQQHGSVYLNGNFTRALAGPDPRSSLRAQFSDSFSRKSSPIWMDTSTGVECAEINAALGGPAEVRSRSGSVAVERFTGPQIRKFWKQDPAAYSRTSRIHLVSSFISSIFAGEPMPVDYGDGAGMNLMNLARLAWDRDLLDATAPGLADKLPSLAPCSRAVAGISPYFAGKYGFSGSCRVCPFTGDNPASLVGMGATSPGQVVISLGTSDTFFAAMESPRTDPSGYGHVFGNPAGGYMSLICFRNGSLARESLRNELGADWSDFEADAIAGTSPLAGKNLTLPFYGAEITPRHDFGTPITSFTTDPSPAARIRSLLEGQFLNMRLHSSWRDVEIDRIRLTGGASGNNGIARLVADVFQAPVERLATPGSAALGAALIAATADGGNLAELQSIFSKTASGSTIEPDQRLAGNYSTALAAFETLLHTTIHS